jgi:hypothetical protein
MENLLGQLLDRTEPVATGYYYPLKVELRREKGGDLPALFDLFLPPFAEPTMDPRHQLRIVVLSHLDDDYRALVDGVGDTLIFEQNDPFGHHLSLRGNDGGPLHYRFEGVLDGYFHVDQGLVAVRFQDGKFVHPKSGIKRYLITPFLHENLRRIGYFPLHAGAVVKNGQAALLIAGPEGGKSTMVLSLAKCGFHALSDDIVFVNGPAGSMRVFASSADFSVRRHARITFPELAPLVPLTPEFQEKVVFNFPKYFSKNFVTEARPACLVFLSGERTGPPSISAIEPADALERILAESLIVTGSEVTQRHLQMLIDVIYTSRAYSFRVGGDYAETIAFIAEFLGHELR